jgi:hypothetical protein
MLVVHGLDVLEREVGRRPSSTFLTGLTTTSSTRSSAAMNGSVFGGPFLPLSAACPASFSSASTSVTTSSSISFWAKSTMPVFPARRPLILTAWTRVKSP